MTNPLDKEVPAYTDERVQTCYVCGGTGMLDGHTCPRCDGLGEVYGETDKEPTDEELENVLDDIDKYIDA